jgi:hypothetical protein
VVILIIALVVLLVATTGRRSGRGGSTAGHYDPDAIGRYTLDPATQAYRLELPNAAPPGKPIALGSGPPHRRRRRRRPTDGTSG